MDRGLLTMDHPRYEIKKLTPNLIVSSVEQSPSSRSQIQMAM